MAITHSTASRNHGWITMGSSRDSSAWWEGDVVVRSGVSCEVILTIVTD